MIVGNLNTKIVHLFELQNLTIKLFSAMNMGSFALILIVTNFVVHGPLRVQVLGWICVSISVSVFAAPLSIVVRRIPYLIHLFQWFNRTLYSYLIFWRLQAQVVRTKSVEFMPFNLSFTLTLSAIMWFGYGLFLKDICIAVSVVVQIPLMNYFNIQPLTIYIYFFSSCAAPECAWFCAGVASDAAVRNLQKRR